MSRTWIIITTLFFTSVALLQAASVGKIIKASGETYVLRKFKKVAIKAEDPLYKKDHLFSKKGGRIDFQLNEGSVIKLAPNTHFKINKMSLGNKKGDKKSVDLELFSGTSKLKVKKLDFDKGERFVVKTPSAVAGVRGTEYIVKHRKRRRGRRGRGRGRSTITGLSGVVALQSNSSPGGGGRTVLVTQNTESSVVGTNDPTPPQQLTTQQVNDRSSEFSDSQDSGDAGSGDGADAGDAGDQQGQDGSQTGDNQDQDAGTSADTTTTPAFDTQSTQDQLQQIQQQTRELIQQADKDVKKLIRLGRPEFKPPTNTN